jgi:hypothetical protein
MGRYSGERSALARRIPGIARLTLGLGLLLWVPSHGSSAAESRVQPRSPEALEAELTGRDVYERVLENRFSSYLQESVLVSGDRAGNDQETRLRMWFKSFRSRDGEARSGDLLSKTLVKYTHPFDIRHSGYLIINNLDRPSDQFVYLPSHRRVRRVNLRGEATSACPTPSWTACPASWSRRSPWS